MAAKFTVKIKTSWKPTLTDWDETGMKIKQKSSHSTRTSGEETEHWANCCVFSGNCKEKKKNPTNLIFHL